MKLSHTRLQIYRSCPARYGYHYVDGLRPRRRDAHRAAGTAIHEALAAGYRAWNEFGGIPYGSLRTRVLEAAHRTYAEHAEEEVGHWMLTNFFSQQLRLPMRPVLVEREHVFSVGGRAFVAHLDAVMYDERRSVLEVHEHKTASSKTAAHAIRRRIENDPQTCAYVFALRSMSHELHKSLNARELAMGTVVYNVLRRAMPEAPRILKDGTVSLQVGPNVTRQRYEAALQAQTSCSEERRKAQGEVLARMPESSFVDCHLHYVSERDLERWQHDVLVDARRIDALEADPSERSRNLEYCSTPGRSCDFRSLCFSDDDKSLRRAEFTTRTERAAR